MGQLNNTDYIPFFVCHSLVKTILVLSLILGGENEREKKNT